jgi:hypothetical protein
VAVTPAAVRALRLPGAPALSEDDARRREELITLLQQHHGNISAVARALGCARMQIIAGPGGTAFNWNDFAAD